MTVAELIRRLEELPSELQVRYFDEHTAEYHKVNSAEFADDDEYGEFILVSDSEPE